MSDLISREEVLRAIITAGEVEPDLGYTHLHKVIENLPSAEPKWITVSERLPEKHQYVLVTYKGLDGRRLVVTTNWNQNTWIESNSIAWMPIPEPWKGGDA